MMIEEIQGFQLSPQQKNLWQRQQADNQTYQVQSAVSINGNLNIFLLKTAIEKVIHRHEILRTYYKVLPGMTIPVQVISESRIIWEQNCDLNSCTGQEQQEKLLELFAEFSHQNISLDANSLLRLSLVTLSSRKYVLFLSLPALSADKTTLKNLVKEISHAYGGNYDISEESLQYADLAAWQNELLLGNDTEAGREYWRKRDISAFLALQLPGEKQNVTSLEFQSQTYIFHLDNNLTTRIAKLTTNYESSIANFLLACYKILLLRLAGQENLVIGFAVNGRKYQELESAFGLISKYIPLQSQFFENLTLIDILNQINKNIHEITHYQEYFDWSILTAEFFQNQSFFPICFEYEEAIENHLAGDISFAIDKLVADIDRYRLKLACIHRYDGIDIEICYDINYFSELNIRRLAEQLETLIESAISHPEVAIGKLKILSQGETKLLSQLNNHKLNYPINKCIHQLFEEQATKTPDKVAIVVENQKITYAELNSQANQIARYLQQLGVGAEVLVGLCVERSLDFVLGILGILKAGGAYVPLDPTYPQERLGLMLQNSQPKVLLTNSTLTTELPENTAQIVYLDRDWQKITQQSDENLHGIVVAANLAYVIYTSGSTGTPKGVRVTHSNLSHYVQAMQAALGIVTKDVYLHTASIAFSSSVRQLMLPLTKGATVTIATLEERKDAIALFEKIKQHHVTVIDIVPSYWRNCNYVLSRLEPNSRQTLLNNSLRLIVSASEPLLADICNKWRFDFQHNASLINMFGQTETCGIVGVYPIPVEQDEQLKIVPLGRAIANTQIYLLDKYLQPVPIGVAGEIYIGGLGISQGYLHRPDLTAVSFIPNPFSEEPGTRLYKTGDLGRYLADGTLEFIGRSDYQVKIRGFRIELAEIEALLTQHPLVRETVVVVREDESNEKRLVAYIVPDQQSTNLKVNDCREFLQSRLPDYMMPSSFLMLEALPLTPNGKVNRKALLTLGESQELETFVAPRNPVEEVIASIWAESIGLSRVGIHDNFFDLGGHSLLATQVIYKMREALQIELPLRSLFDAPTVAEIAKQITTCKNSTVSTLEFAIVPNPVDRHLPFPLTDIQQAYWIGRNGAFELSNVATHSYREIDCDDLDLEKFNQAWQRLIERHDMLRAIVQPDGQQRILMQVPAYQIQVLDLRGESPEIIATQLREIRDRMSHQVLPADCFPLFDIRATRVGEELTRLHLSFDLLIGDAWSYQIIGRELALLMQNPDSFLAPLEVSFRDYVLAEIALQNSQSYSRSLEYWQSRLKSLPSSPELPLEKNLAAITNPRFQRRTGRLEPATWQRLQQKADKFNINPSGILLAAYGEILSLWSKNPSLTINLTLFNRIPLHPQINQVVGDFTSLNLLAIDNSGQDSFIVRAQRIQQQLWDDLDHRYVSGVRVLRELAQVQERNSGALMPVVFTSTLSQDSQSGFASPLDWLGEVVYNSSQTPQVYLDHVVGEAAGALIFYWNAVEELFPTGLLDDMFAAYSNFLELLANEDEIWHSQTRQLLPAVQLEQITAINHTTTPLVETYQQRWGNPALLHTLFFDQVALYANKDAIISSVRTLTYQELSDRSLQLGHQLYQLGVCPGKQVAIVMEKGWEQIVAALAILACGAAYVPIDPKLPKERLWQLLEATEVQHAIAQSRLDSTLKLPDYITRICIDTLDVSDLYLQPLYNISPTSLAYIIYTSGSTGVPKGVMIDHQGAVNTIFDINQRFHVQSTDRVIALSSLSFDLSVYDIFGTLATGGTIVIPDAERQRDPDHWLELMQQHQVTIWNSVPALMQMLLESASDRNYLLPASLRLVLLSGDWLPLNLPVQIRAIWDSVQIVSLGGATEASIWSIYYPITTVDPTWKSIPYGRPMANQRFYVLNAALDPCPIWVTGQLYIGGIGLAQGYWKNQEKTDSSFIIHPQTQERLYKTGDLGRYLPDGNIEFLGREDFQVKVNGYRIELGEIEVTLQKHPAIKEVVVNAVGESRNQQQLFAYVVLENTSSGQSLEDLQQFLRDKLPEYMIPSTYIFLDNLPLTANGKIDRRSLPLPENIGSEINSTDSIPLTQIEKRIASIWQDLLVVRQVNVNSNFFELGANSLTATQLAARIRSNFNIDLPLAEVFTSPTLKELSEIVAAAIVDQESEQQHIIPVRVSQLSQSDLIPLSFAQQRLWFLEQLQPGNTLYNFPAAVRLQGQLNVTALEQSINQLIKRHEILRTTFSTVDGQPVQVIHPSLDLKLSIIDLTITEHSTVENLILAEQNRPFDLINGSVLRTSLLKLSATEYILLFVMHHIISDGWSMGVIIQEISSLYAAFAKGETATLPELPIQYADFAVWQRQWLQGEILTNQLTYWQQQLNNLPILELPTDFQRPEQQTFRGAKYTSLLPKSLSEDLKQLSTTAGVTLFMTLLAGFDTLLHWYTNQDNIVVGTDIANRNHLGTEGLIGFFINQLVLRINLGGNPSFQELLERVRDRTLSAYTYQDLPFDKLVETINPDRDLSRSPLFQVKFILQNAPIPPLELPGLTLSFIDTDRGVAEFDLLLEMTDTEQGLITTFKYNKDLFHAQTIIRMLNNFEILLGHIVSQPDAKLQDLKAILVTADNHQRLNEEKEYERSMQENFINFKRRSHSKNKY
jgi:amino acid adenylation domain-containing protein